MTAAQKEHLRETTIKKKEGFAESANEQALGIRREVEARKTVADGCEKSLERGNLSRDEYEKLTELTGVDKSVTTRLKYVIQSVDGDTNQKTIDDFVDNEFLTLDARAFRVYRESIEPDIIMKFDYTSQTGGSHKLDIPLGVDFFWPAAE